MESDTAEIGKISEKTPPLIDSLKLILQSTNGCLANCLTWTKRYTSSADGYADERICLINGQLGSVYNFAYIDCQISKVFVKFDHRLTDNNAMSKDIYTKTSKFVPFTKVE